MRVFAQGCVYCAWLQNLIILFVCFSKSILCYEKLNDIYCTNVNTFFWLCCWLLRAVIAHMPSKQVLASMNRIHIVYRLSGFQRL